MAAGGEVLGRGLEGLHLLGHFLVHDIAAGVHQGIVEPVVEPLLVHGAETGVVVQDKPGLRLNGQCDMLYSNSRGCYLSCVHSLVCYADKYGRGKQPDNSYGF